MLMALAIIGGIVVSFAVISGGVLGWFYVILQRDRKKIVRMQRPHA